MLEMTKNNKVCSAYLNASEEMEECLAGAGVVTDSTVVSKTLWLSASPAADARKSLEDMDDISRRLVVNGDEVKGDNGDDDEEDVCGLNEDEVVVVVVAGEVKLSLVTNRLPKLPPSFTGIRVTGDGENGGKGREVGEKDGRGGRDGRGLTVVVVVVVEVLLSLLLKSFRAGILMSGNLAKGRRNGGRRFGFRVVLGVDVVVAVDVVVVGLVVGLYEGRICCLILLENLRFAVLT